MKKFEEIKEQILRALQHPEADEGLYFRNLSHLHEEDERDAVDGDEVTVRQALTELVEAGKVMAIPGEEELVFKIAALAKKGR